MEAPVEARVEALRPNEQMLLPDAYVFKGRHRVVRMIRSGYG
jgi:hypothetical protein